MLHEAGHELIWCHLGRCRWIWSWVFKKRPTKIADKQASAAVGQGLLLDNLLMRQIVSAQILLTQDDLWISMEYKNAHQASVCAVVVQFLSLTRMIVSSC